MTLTQIAKGMWAAVPYLEGKKDFPLRHFVVLLHIMEHGETTSPDIQEALGEAQPAISACVRALRGLGLVVAYRGDGANSRRDMLALTDFGKEAMRAILKASK